MTPALNWHVAIMKEMDRSGYGGSTSQDLVSVIGQQRGEVWRYQNENAEIVVLFQYSAARAKWQLGTRV